MSRSCVLAIETSCDETAASLVREEGGRLTVLAHTVSSQVELHAKWGGVVPNLAAREHVRNILPVLEQTLAEARFTQKDIDAIAVTQGPGLIPALLIGTTAAKTLSLAWNKPLIGINHLEGHIYANLLGARNDQTPIADFQFPLLALIVSGGHTMLVLMRDHFQYELLGETEDDAVGEAFDKVAKMLGLPYPGGPEIARRADRFRQSGRDADFSFPRPMLESKNYQFSFSGLKTAVLYFLKKEAARPKDENFTSEVSHAFQEAAVDVLVGKTEMAIRNFHPKTLVIAGGVSANVRLRERIETMVREDFPKTEFLMPPIQYSLDNASMIGAAAAYRLARMSEEERTALKKNALALEPDANLPLISNLA